METIKLTCIGCPLGCSLEVDVEGGNIAGVRGNNCKNGESYAHDEVTNPLRVVTSTVRLLGSKNGASQAPCKTAHAIPKGKIGECMRELSRIAVAAPVRIGDAALKDVAGTGIDVVITRDMD